jgi:hypothetical protein
MAWIKRNLSIVIGGIVALALLGGAGYYTFTKWKHNTTVGGEVRAQYDELQRISNLDPHPGNNKVDNIELARKYRDNLTNVIVRATREFEPIPRIPAVETVTSQDFASALRRTIDQLQRESANASVNVPERYGFSFEAQRKLLNFDTASLLPLSVQLGEIKAICDVLNRAKVNSFDGIRRERVSTDDVSGPQTDYVERNSVTNKLAIISPYELSFRCFTPELAEVLMQFANSRHGFVVKSINVDIAPATTSGVGAAPNLQRRIGDLQVFINERQLRVTMVLEVIKLLPKA